jgi:hypothetical protein
LISGKPVSGLGLGAVDADFAAGLRGVEGLISSLAGWLEHPTSTSTIVAASSRWKENDEYIDFAGVKTFYNTALTSSILISLCSCEKNRIFAVEFRQDAQWCI